MNWRILYPDPPWPYQNWTDKKNGAAAGHYTTVSIEEMARWPVRALAHRDSLCFMWATFPLLKEGIWLLEQWGFKYVTTPFVWVKHNRVNKEPFFGPGFWTRSGAEICLLGRRGRGVRRKDSGVPQVVYSPMVGHSRKPYEVAWKINRLVGMEEPKLEIFARKDPITGESPPHLNGSPYTGNWTGTGLEYDGKLLTDFIEENT